MPISFEKSHLAEIQRHGEATYPQECCGFLLGRAEADRRIVQQIRAAPNMRTDSPQNRYEISPKDYLRMDREARERGLEIIGFYHSHPDHPARPSAFDLENAWPGLVYVILTVNRGKAGAITAWVLSDDRSKFLPEEFANAADLKNFQF
ncbi:MAG: M67 family metallopeptidase [candidate division KSB1 bacterium]|nr:M67 family metallopeptidase [candidate division KSB1 bacterium]MDZ7368912.1 M67 family metallopeptidase [candidate division KSB1 bacterium]MDZ7406900.1 M67 family metallopeptidase [candidate division KSB1 bacterium]